MTALESARETDVLLLAAHPLELEPLSHTLGPELRARIGDVWVTAMAVGVGLPAAGAGAAHALLACRPRAAVLLGSYGAYPGQPFTPGHLLVPARVCAVDCAELGARAAFPAPMVRAIEPAPELAAALAAAAGNSSRGALATTLGITTDDALARELAERSGCEGENLESLAVAHACAITSVPFCAALACTNQVGSQGRSQWAQHRALAARTTSDLILRWLNTSAPGLPSR